MTSFQRVQCFIATFIVMLIMAGLGGCATTGTGTPAGNGSTGRVDVGPAEFAKLAGRKDVVVVDVRPADAYQAGHIAGAVNIPVAAADFEERVKKLDKDKTYCVYCRSGNTSLKASATMQAVGLTHLYNLTEGINGWTSAKMPVETGSK